MLFSSITFLYFFLPLVLVLHRLAPGRVKNIVLLLMSLLFYAWGEPVYIFLMLTQILVSYILTILMDKYRDCFAGRICLIISIAIPFMALIFFKYTNFLMQDIFGIRTTFFEKLALPIGISFYTFQLISYNVDVWKKTVPCQKNPIVLATYVTLFPQLIAGPIVRFSDIEQAFVSKNQSDEIRIKNFEKGVIRFCIGLGKKVLIANILGEFITEISELSGRTITLSWAYAFAIALQIYFDFSGYSDMAIGIGSMLGFEFPENFKYPFIAKSIAEFWRRWHITLGSWFRDYIYIPLGGNRVSVLRWIVNILVVWMFTGLWHGADWNFILWGLYFAAFLVVEKIVKNISKKIWVDNLSFTESKIYRYFIVIVKHIYVIITLVISFLIFHNVEMDNAINDIMSLFSADVYKINSLTDVMVCEYTLRNRIVILCVALVASTPLPLTLWKKLSDYLPQFIVYALRTIGIISILVLSTAYLIDGSFNPFLYFRF